MSLVTRKAAKALLRARVQGIVTEEAVSAYVRRVEEAAVAVAAKIARVHDAETRSRREKGLDSRPRLEARHTKDITVNVDGVLTAGASGRREVTKRNEAVEIS